jgi:predicted Zn-dependent protease
LRNPVLLIWAVAFIALVSGGNVQAHAGDHRTLAELDAIIKKSPAEAALLVARGALYSRSGQWDKAERDLRLAETLSSKEDVAFELGQLYYRRGDHQKALEYIDTYIGAYPNYPPAFLLRARAAGEAKQFDLAHESYYTYFSLSPDPQPGEYLAAVRLLAATKPAGINNALALLDMAISKLGLNPQLQRYAMQLELRRDDIEGALDRWYSLEDQLRETPEWGITLARVLILADKVDEARLVVQTVKDRLISLRQTPARKAAGETIARLERQLDEVQTNY